MEIVANGPRDCGSIPGQVGVVAIEKGAFESPSTTVPNFTFYNSPHDITVIVQGLNSGC